MGANRGQGHLSQGNAPLNGVNGVNGNGNGFQGVEMPVVNHRQNKGLLWPLKGDSLVKGKALLKCKDVEMPVIIFLFIFILIQTLERSSTLEKQGCGNACGEAPSS
jgi:hypothetical protein